VIILVIKKVIPGQTGVRHGQRTMWKERGARPSWSPAAHGRKLRGVFELPSSCADADRR
jgi:hypothetical protein